MRDYTFFVYILTNASRRSLYIGVTNALKVRVQQHKEKVHDGFTARYNVNRLVYYEVFQYIHAAIAREKQLKGWTRARKLELIRTRNPQFRDLSAEWFRQHPAEVHTFGDHIHPDTPPHLQPEPQRQPQPQDASTPNPERPPDSPLSMTRVKR
jgi:putative endonuclease